MSVFSGKVVKIGIFELKETQKVGWFADKTHSVVCKVDADHKGWISINSVKKDETKDITWRSKINDEWTEIWEGATVEFMYDEDDNGYWKRKDKTYIDVVKNGDQKPESYKYHRAKGKADTPQNQAYQKKDYSGVEIGHALNCALWVKKHKLADIDGILSLSKNLHDITKNLKKEYKEKNPKMSDYDLGASVGNAVLNACRVGGTEKTIEKNAKKILDELVPVITAYVRGEEVVEEHAHDHIDPDEPGEEPPPF